MEETIQIDIKGSNKFGYWYEKKYNEQRNYCNIGDYVYKSKAKLNEIIDIIVKGDIDKDNINYTQCCNSVKTYVKTKIAIRSAIVSAQIDKALSIQR